MPATSLNDLYLQQLQLLLDAEAQGLDAMPHLAQLVRDTKLHDTLQTHRRQSQEHARRLEQLIGSRGRPARSGECVSMRALIEEALDTLATIEDPDTIDAFVISAQQAIEHHEIAAYGTARAWARQLGFGDDADVLQKTLKEESDADESLSRIAEGHVNERATQGAEREVGIARGGPADRTRVGSDELGHGAGRLLDVDVQRGADMR